jgi:hypothetical protein
MDCLLIVRPLRYRASSLLQNNILFVLELIHMIVESLDVYFGGVVCKC